MAAPTIPPIRRGLIGTGLAVEKLRWPALRRLAGRYVVTAFTDRSAEQSKRFADYSGPGPDRAVLLARDDVDAVLIAVPMVVQRALDSAERATVLALDPVPGGGPVSRGPTGLPGQRISSSASFAT